MLEINYKLYLCVFIDVPRALDTQTFVICSIKSKDFLMYHILQSARYSNFTFTASWLIRLYNGYFGYFYFYKKKMRFYTLGYSSVTCDLGNGTVIWLHITITSCIKKTAVINKGLADAGLALLKLLSSRQLMTYISLSRNNRRN